MAKKVVPATAGAHPRSGEEALKVAKGLKEKYPQMYKPGWGVAKAIKKARGKSVPFRSVAEHRGVSKETLGGALSKKEIERLRGKK